jgi:hypothetical protein
MTQRTLRSPGRIEALKAAPPGERYTLYDALIPGFGVRVTDKGAKSFIVYRRIAGDQRPRRLSLGAYRPLRSAGTSRQEGGPGRPARRGAAEHFTSPAC